jgi:hypothetical protein
VQFLVLRRACEALLLRDQCIPGTAVVIVNGHAIGGRGRAEGGKKTGLTSTSISTLRLQSLEAVSQAFECDEYAGDVYEGLEEFGFTFVADDESAVVLEPGEGAFDFPATLVAAEFPAVL